jgi:hypothetical protein
VKFDSKAEIAIPARLASTGGAEQEVLLRYPTDEEWSARSRSRKIIIRRLGRGMSETVPPEPGEADVKLYKTIALNGAPDMTPAEASKVLEALSVADVYDVSIDGGEAAVEMSVMTGRAIHHMKIPTADQVLSFRRSAFRLIDLPFNQQELRTTADAGARLYDQCGGRSEDYANGIPALHKDAAIRAVIEHIDRALGPRSDDANF